MALGFIEQPREWLRKAERDLNGSRSMFRDTYYDLAVYHVQQCAEKAFKGYLCSKEHELLKTHDLRMLLNACEKYDAEFNEIRFEALNINALDVKFRYPAPIFEPPMEATEEVIAFGQIILDFVVNKCT